MEYEISLTEDDDFDREGAELGNSERFMGLLEKRSKERGVISIERFAEELTQEMQGAAKQPVTSTAKPRRAPSARTRPAPRRG